MKAKLTYVLVFILLTPIVVFGHDVVKDLENISKSEAAYVYLNLGFKHIIPLGLDHILFIISLVLVSTNIKQLIWLSGVFTIGHCVTLGLATYGVFSVSSQIIEPLIALSIVYVAIENLVSNRIKTSRIVLVFIFGLLHGLGFAGALSEIGLPKNSYLLSLLLFNVGVELGQICIIIGTFYLIKFLKNRPLLNWQKIMVPVSSVIIAVGTYWFLERIL